MPILPREGAIALGMSDFECARRVTLPWVGTGIVGAVGARPWPGARRDHRRRHGRAGSRSAPVAGNIYAAMTTIAATIVHYLDSAFTDPTGLAITTLAELGLVLMVITLATNVAARLLVRRVSGTALPVGRGL